MNAIKLCSLIIALVVGDKYCILVAVQIWQQSQIKHNRIIKGLFKLLHYSFKKMMSSAATYVHVWQIRYWQHAGEASVGQQAAAALVGRVGFRLLANSIRVALREWHQRVAQSQKEQTEMQWTAAAAEALSSQQANSTFRSLTSCFRGATKGAKSNFIHRWRLNQLAAVYDKHMEQLKATHKRKLDGVNDLSKQKLMVQRLRSEELAMKVSQLRIGTGVHKCNGLLKQYVHDIEVHLTFGRLLSSFV